MAQIFEKNLKQMKKKEDSDGEEQDPNQNNEYASRFLDLGETGNKKFNSLYESTTHMHARVRQSVSIKVLQKKSTSISQSISQSHVEVPPNLPKAEPKRQEVEESKDPVKDIIDDDLILE